MKNASGKENTGGKATQDEAERRQLDLRPHQKKAHMRDMHRQGPTEAKGRAHIHAGTQAQQVAHSTHHKQAISTPPTTYLWQHVGVFVTHLQEALNARTAVLRTLLRWWDWCEWEWGLWRWCVARRVFRGMTATTKAVPRGARLQSPSVTQSCTRHRPYQLILLQRQERLLCGT